MKREEIFQYVKEQYGTEPEYLWKKDPDSAVLRHKNGKWYAIIMAVEKKTLGLEEDGKINILDVKCDPDLVGMLIQTYGFLPGYHMNKRHWITILLDESVSEAKTLDFLFMIYELILNCQLQIGIVELLIDDSCFRSMPRIDYCLVGK